MTTQDCSLTVVIPTLGGSLLVETVDSIMAGSFIPQKILIVIPEDRLGTLPQLQYKNVEILATNFRGQVQQRIYGFNRAQTEFVMQLDDDIILDTNCLRYLLNRCSLQENLAVGPMLIDAKTSIPIYKKTKNGFWGFVYYWLLNGHAGYQPGKFYLSGSGEGVSQNLSPGINVEWLAGGCVLHRKSNLILKNYFPYSGKAYCEDYIHSYLLNQAGVKMATEHDAIAYLEVSGYMQYSFLSFIKNQYNDFRARKYFQKLRKVSSFRIYNFYLIIFLNYALTKIRFLKIRK